MSAYRRPWGRGTGLAAAAGRRPGAAARIAGAQSARLRHAPFAMFVAGLLAYGAAFAWHLLDRFDLVNLIRDVNYDDSFYYFQIAYHLAEGKFSTFDGGISRTNGYHPLWLLLITPFYWVFDKTEALFAIKAFEIMLVAGGVALAAGAARVARLPWILLFAALPALYGNPALFLGLEAAAGLFMLGLFLLAVCLFARDPARWRWPLAAAAFALPWVRLEYVAVSVAATAALCLAEWSERLPAALAGGERGGWGRSGPGLNAAAPLSGAVAGILAYFTWNAVVFGGVVPVSGAAKQWLSQLRWERSGHSLTDNFHGFLRTGFFDDELLAALEVCVYAVVVWWFSRRSRGRDDWLLLAFLVGVSGLAAGHLAKFAQSVLTFYHGWSRFDWQYVPAYLMVALVVPARCGVAVWFVRRFVGPWRGSRIPSLGIVVAGAVFLFATMDFAAPFRFVDRHRDVASSDWQVHAYMGTMAMNRLLPEDSVVGSWDSGLMAYFSRFPVVNLDGLVNSWDYLRARKKRAEAAFHQRYGITNLVASSFWPPRDATLLFENPDEADRSAWFWERMEPHLERQADGVGVLVDGRLGQAFVRNCTDALAEWTWAGQEEPVRTSWLQAPVGFCTSTVVLPHDALPPVRAAVAASTPGEYLAGKVGGRRPVIRSDFDVYVVEDRLVYVKEACGPEDVDAPFFVAVYPIDPDDLPGSRRRHGFDNLDFRFDEYGDRRNVRIGGACVTEILLPEYGIAAIRTGQYVGVEGGFHHPWEGEIRP